MAVVDMNISVNVFDKRKDIQLFEAHTTDEGMVAILKRMTTLKQREMADFMHELRETGSSSILEESALPYEIVATL